MGTVGHDSADRSLVLVVAPATKPVARVGDRPPIVCDYATQSDVCRDRRMRASCVANGSLSAREFIQHRALAGRKPGIAQHPPDPDVRVEERRLGHRKTSISDSSTTLANGSPVNAPRPRRASHVLSSRAGTRHLPVLDIHSLSPARLTSRILPGSSLRKCQRPAPSFFTQSSRDRRRNTKTAAVIPAESTQK